MTKRKGWTGEKQRHSVAKKGVKTSAKGWDKSVERHGTGRTIIARGMTEQEEMDYAMKLFQQVQAEKRKRMELEHKLKSNGTEKCYNCGAKVFSNYTYCANCGAKHDSIPSEFGEL